MRLSALVAAADGGLLPVSNDGADPLITAVVTTDLLDPSRYLNGGELVLSGLAWWRPRSPARTRTFVQALVNARVAALAAGEAGFDGVPGDLVQACHRAGLTLLKVPVDVAFATITDQAAQHLSARRADDVAAVLGRHRALVAGAAGGSDGLAQVLDLVRTDLGLRARVLSPTGRLIAGAAASGAPAAAPSDAPSGAPAAAASDGSSAARSDGPWDAGQTRLLAEQFLRAPSLPHRTALPGGGWVSLFAAGTAPRAGSWLLAVAEDHVGWSGQRRAVVDELARIVAQERDRARSDVDDELAAALAGSSPADVAALLLRRGAAPDELLVAVTALGVSAVDVLAEVFADESGWYGRPGGAAAGEGAVGQVPSGEGAVGQAAVGLVRSHDAAAVVRRVQAVVDALSPGLGNEPLRVGVSDAVSGGAELLAAVAEANAAALTAGLQVGLGSGLGLGFGGASPHTVAGPDLLVSHSLLLAAVPQQLRDGYKARVLGALIEHDRQHHTQLLRTLEAYLACSGSWARCAEMMHVHVNTLRYRIERIEALTGRDLRRLDDQVDLLLALALR